MTDYLQLVGSFLGLVAVVLPWIRPALFRQGALGLPSRPMTSSAVPSACEALVSAIKAEVRTEFLAALGEHEVGNGRRAAGRKKPGPKPKGAKLKARPKGAKRTANEIDELIGHTLKFIKSNPGSRSEQIAEGLGVTTKDLGLPITKLFESKALKSTGQKRGTKYSA